MTKIAIYKNFGKQLYRQINVAQSKSNDVHIYPGYDYNSDRVSTICTVVRSAHDLTSWPSG